MIYYGGLGIVPVFPADFYIGTKFDDVEKK